MEEWEQGIIERNPYPYNSDQEKDWNTTHPIEED